MSGPASGSGRPEAARAIVVAGGERSPRPDLRGLLPGQGALVVAADSGVHHADALGLRVDVVVGDLDSVEPAALQRALSAGASLQRHPPSKDRTDLDLAMAAAMERTGRGAHLTVVASAGGRLDHALANLCVLAAPEWAEVEVGAFVDDWRIDVVRTRSRVRVRRGRTVTLLPMGGDARGVWTESLAYPLRGETLPWGSSRGVSNVAEADAVVVGVEGGVVLVLHEWAD